MECKVCEHQMREYSTHWRCGTCGTIKNKIGECKADLYKAKPVTRMEVVMLWLTGIFKSVLMKLVGEI